MDWNFQDSIKDSDILVVDDNVVNQKVLCKVLESNGYRTTFAVNGESALEAIKMSRPDLVLLDVQMPDIDGFEVCRRLKDDPETEDIAVIFITASDTIESKVKGFKVGGVDYISRPLQMPEVLARVKNQLTIQSLQRDAEHEKERLEKILAALPVPYLMSKIKDSSLIEMNDMCCSTLDVAQEDLKNYKSTDFYARPEIRNELIELVRRNGLVSNHELELKTRTGHVFTTLFSATPLRLAGDDVFFVTFNDITERKEMEVALEKAATTDYLTGTLNRRSFTDRAISERSRALRNKHDLALLMIDIDRFKVINDTYGHDVGDDALQTLVELVGHDLRASDALGRLGGEEFALLLPETDFAGAKILAERIRQRVEDNKMILADGKEITMTLSGGLIDWDTELSYEEALKISDDRLYTAKQTGRNKIVSE